MNSLGTRSAFVLHIKKNGKKWRFVVDDLRQQRRLEFDSWQSLQDYVERVMQRGLR